jgi:hypothetical protein
VPCEPAVFSAPDQSPEAAQEVALVVDHVSVEPLPDATVVGLAASLMTGAAADTVTVADCVAEPPGPLQVISYWLVARTGPVEADPLSGCVPCQSPKAVQLLASSVLQANVELDPGATVAGVAVNAIVGAGGTTSMLTD